MPNETSIHQNSVWMDEYGRIGKKKCRTASRQVSMELEGRGQCAAAEEEEGDVRSTLPYLQIKKKRMKKKMKVQVKQRNK